jgi:hypothetical protein
MAADFALVLALSEVTVRLYEAALQRQQRIKGPEKGCVGGLPTVGSS